MKGFNETSTQGYKDYIIVGRAYKKLVNNMAGFSSRLSVKNSGSKNAILLSKKNTWSIATYQDITSKKNNCLSLLVIILYYFYY